MVYNCHEVSTMTSDARGVLLTAATSLHDSINSGHVLGRHATHRACAGRLPRRQSFSEQNSGDAPRHGRLLARQPAGPILKMFLQTLGASSLVDARITCSRLSTSL